jgi:Family of unknown function (DUF6152)
MERRFFLGAASALWLPAAWAHHGWSSFDASRPLYLEGRAATVAWRNPHVEIGLEVSPGLKLPADLGKRTLPAQSAQVEGAKLLAAAQLPTRQDKLWQVELAPLTRMSAWQVEEIKPGQQLSMLGYTFEGEKGDPVLRVEYLWVGDKAYGLRSSPA